MEDLHQEFVGSGVPGPAELGWQPNAADETAALLSAAERGWRVEPDYRIRSHRPLLRYLIDPFKRLIHWGGQPYVRLLIEKQEQFNAHVLALLRLQLARQQNVDAEMKRAHGVFQEALERADRFIGHQSEISDYFEQSRQALEAAQARLEHSTRSLIERYDFAPFFEGISREKRAAFVDRFRGTYGHLRGLHHSYLPLFRDRPGPILDVGCGRGEFLAMMRMEGIAAWGCDPDPAMIETCREHEVTAVHADALAALRSIEVASLGGIFASQVIEHLFPGELLTVLKLARERLAPGGVIVLETLNPETLGVLAKSYYQDLDHKQPVDPEYLAGLLELRGFERVELHRLRRFEPADRLPDLPPPAQLGLGDPAYGLLKGMVERLNAVIWGPQDYYVVAEVPAAS
jgi:SAM-dependent methyltransferase